MVSWTAIALVGGCTQARTELVLVVDSEIAWGPGRPLQSVALTVRRGEATGPLRSSRTTLLGPGGERLPMLVGVIETLGDTATPVWIEVLGCSAPSVCTSESAVVAQRAVVRFVSGQTMELPLLLASACAGVTCASAQRCETSSGRCEAATRAQEMVRRFTGNVDPSGHDAAMMDVSSDATTIVDSSLDIGTADLGAMETGMADARPLDTGPRDAGLVDAGLVDAGLVDAGLVDAGLVDAGLVDAGPALVCAAQAGNRTCHGSGGLAPCCIPVLIATSCGCQVPLFGCLLCP